MAVLATTLGVIALAVAFGAELPNDEGRALARADSLETLAGELREFGDHQGAMRACLAAVLLKIDVLGPEHEDVASALNDEIGQIMWNSIWDLRKVGRYTEASVLADSFAYLRESTPGVTPHKQVNARLLASTVRFAATLPDADQRALARADSLRDVIQSTSDHDAAIELIEEQLATRRRLLGDDHPDLTRSLSLLGSRTWDRGDFARAEEARREAVRVALVAYGENHPNTASYITNLSESYKWMDEFAKAESLSIWSYEIRKRIYGESHPNPLLQLSLHGWLKMEMGDYPEAESILREALEGQIAARGENHGDVGLTTNNLALLLQWLDRYEESEELYKKALDIRRAVFGEVSVPTAVSTHGYAALRSARGDHVTAEKLYRQAMEIYTELLHPDHPRIGEIMHGLSVALRSLGRYDESDAMVSEVIDRWPEQRVYVARAYTTLAANASSRGNPIAAEDFTRKALDIFVETNGPDDPDSAGQAYVLASRMYARGDLVACESVAREALRRMEAVFETENTAVLGVRQLLARVYASRGDLARAEAEIRDVLEAQRRIEGGDHISVADRLLWLANVIRRTGRLAEARVYSREALAMARRVIGEEHPSVARYLNEVASGYMHDREFAAAESLLQQALDIETEALGSHNLKVALRQRQLGDCARARDDLDLSEDLYSECFEIERDMLGEKHPRRMFAIGKLATIRHTRGDNAGAEALFAEAAYLYDLARQRVGTGMERASFAQASPYGWMALTQLAQGKGDGAWVSVERTASRALVDLLADAESRTLTQREKAIEDSLRGQIASLEQQVAAYMASAEVDSTAVAPEEIEELNLTLSVFESEWSTFRYEMAERHPESEGRVLSLDGVQDALDAETAIIGWLDVERFDGVTESWAYAVRDRGSVTWARLEDTGPDERKPAAVARAVRNAIADPSSPLLGIARETRALWQQRFAPVAGALEGVRNLVVVPSGPLLGVPVEALTMGDGRFVGESYDVSYTPSGTVYARLGGGQLAQMEPGRALFVGDPPFLGAHLAEMESESGSPWELLAIADDSHVDAALLRSAMAGDDRALAGLPRLRGTRAEVLLLSEGSPTSTVLLGPDASEQGLMALARSGALSRYGTIHIATHALVHDEHPEQSALVLSQVGLPDPLAAAMVGERVYDGLLTAKEIVAEFELDADLVTLSACETGLGREMVGEGYVGFAHAFLQAGARSLVVSLWRVDDTATALLMKRFYENRSGCFSDERSGRIAEPLGKASALAEARAWLRGYEDESGRRPYEHPYYWSAFVLIGARD